MATDENSTAPAEKIPENLPTEEPATTNVVTGDSCVRWCDAGKNALALEMFRLLAEFLTATTQASQADGGVIEFAGFAVNPSQPITQPATPIGPQTQVPQAPTIRYRQPTRAEGGQRGTTLVLGLVSLAAWTTTQINGFEAALAEFQEAMQKITQRTTLKKSCEDCCRKKLLSQKNPRKVLIEKDKKRIRTANESLQSPVQSSGG